MSVVVPVFHSIDTLDELYRQLTRVLQGLRVPYEILFVDDASPDDSWNVLTTLAKTDPAVAAIAHRNNVGQHAALRTGLSFARGQAVVTMDADLQDEPRHIPSLMEELRRGNHAVFASKSGHYESRLRLLESRIFKTCLSALTCGRLPRHSSLYLVMDRIMISRLLACSLPNPNLLVLMAWTGLKMSWISVQRKPRPQWTSSYSFSSRLNVAVQAVITVLRLSLPVLRPHPMQDNIRECAGRRF